MSSVEQYVCHLDAQSIEKARKELNEVEKEREGAIQTLRDWITQQSWLHSPTDSAFLLRFLRVRKFSQLGARQTIENFWTRRTKLPEWFAGVSPETPGVLELISSGFFLLLPQSDSEGRRIFIERTGSLNLKEIKTKYKHLNIIFQTIMCVMDMMCMDERVQVNGIIKLIDATDKDGDLSQVYNRTTVRKFIPLYEHSYPTRMKGVHFYNLNVVFDSLLKFGRTLLIKEKMAKRIHVHGRSLVSVYDVIDKRLLPREYLPDEYDGPCAGTVAEIVEKMKAELCRPEVVSHIKDLNSGRHKVDLEQRKTEDVPAESFRKLNIE